MYAKTLIRWIALGSLVGVAAGAGSALFLWLLAEATTWRVDHETIVFALPAAGPPPSPLASLSFRPPPPLPPPGLFFSLALASSAFFSFFFVVTVRLPL